MLAGGEDKFDKFYTHNDWQTCGLVWQTCGGEDGEGLLKPTTPILGHCLDSLGISDPPGRRLKNAAALWGCFARPTRHELVTYGQVHRTVLSHFAALGGCFARPARSGFCPTPLSFGDASQDRRERRGGEETAPFPKPSDFFFALY